MSARSVMVEVASVLTIAGSVIAIAIPKAGEIQSGRTATTLSEDLATVQSAVLAFYSDSAYFPAEVAQGDIPATLEPYLPARFSFRRAYGTLEYRNWPARAPFRSPAADSTPGRDSLPVDSTAADSAREIVAAPVDSALAALAPMVTRPGLRIPTAPGVPTTAPAAVAGSDSLEGIAAGDSASVGRVIGVSVTTRDPRVAALAAQRARRMARFIVGDKVTFVLFGA